MFRGLLLLPQGILILGHALSLLPGFLSADDGEAPSMKLVCATQCFLLLILLSPGGELAVVARLPTVFFRWLGAIQNYVPLPYQMNSYGKVWPSSPVTELASFPTDGANVEASRPCDPRSCQVDTRSQPRLSSGSVIPAKGIRTGCPDTPSDGFVSHGSRD